MPRSARRSARPAGEHTAGGMTCCEVLAVFSELLDGELDPPRRRRVEAHLAQCRRCRRTAGEVEALVRGCHHLLDQAPPLDPGLHRRLLARIAAEAGNC